MMMKFILVDSFGEQSAKVRLYWDVGFICRLIEEQYSSAEREGKGDQLLFCCPCESLLHLEVVGESLKASSASAPTSLRRG